MPRKAISSTTRAQIKGYLEAFIENLVRRYKQRRFERPASFDEYLARKPKPKEGKLRPFHAAIVPPEIRRMSAFERGLSTGLGSTFEECARLIALEHHETARRNYAVVGEVSLSAIAELEQQVAMFEKASDGNELTVKPQLEDMVKAVLKARRSDDAVQRTSRADLYVLATDGAEYYFEIKSPDANKGQCLEVTQRILRIHLLRGERRPKVQAYLAMAYNPDGPAREDYSWSIVKTYMPFDQAVIIGKEFWEIIGGATAYQELLEIYAEVGQDKAKGILDALSYGF